MTKKLNYNNQIYEIDDNLRLILYLTDKCSQKCPFCIDKLDKKINDNIEIDELLHKALSIIKQLNSYYVELFGGEPTLNIQNFKKAVEFFENNKISMAMMTNGLNMLKCFDFFHNSFCLLLSREHYDEEIQKKLVRSNKIISNNDINLLINKFFNKNFEEFILYCVVSREGVRNSDDVSKYIETFPHKDISYLFVEMVGNYKVSNNSDNDYVYYQNNVIDVDLLCDDIKKNNNFQFLDVKEDNEERVTHFLYKNMYKISLIKNLLGNYNDNHRKFKKRNLYLRPNGELYIDHIDPLIKS